ncbi:Nicotinamide-nucleotide amidase [Lentibacillus sp. JNUCC-1]|uniref:CinA family nicotinamide mononucleotide deamidase-related protein n=1 Tax=Lentibacillus sp. JNUCC-1 TaxID=2654513 RepID=UPI0013217765|nr:CinA family nicotinamide mononucleotide deamidase-related protein [Lentibacillus sp. JNUCC-1]MUV39891.1 Nicotinamide-nucleotide amidase [Lentibacillus sp. JNUCC-1]
MTPNNRRQARVFEGAEVLDNTAGMAPGMMLKQNECIWVFLPGVPREMKRLFLDDVQPYIKRLSGSNTTIKSTILKFTGIGESQLEHELKDLISNQHNPTIAPLSQLEGNVIRLTAKAETTEEVAKLINETKSHIVNRLTDYYVGCDEDTLESVIIERLKETGMTIGAAESLTGGLFTSKLISIPGASAVCSGGIVCYQNNQKKTLVGVSEQTLSKYGAVSEQCALEMASGARTALETDIGIGFTGVAGPEPSENKPAGTVYIAISHKNRENTVQSLSLEGDRDKIRQKTVIKGMEILYKTLK